jgi:hypothetical protein
LKNAQPASDSIVSALAGIVGTPPSRCCHSSRTSVACSTVVGLTIRASSRFAYGG